MQLDWCPAMEWNDRTKEWEQQRKKADVKKVPASKS